MAVTGRIRGALMVGCWALGLVLLLLLLLLAVTATPTGAAAVGGACDGSGAGVGTKLLYEDDDIKVWDMELQPGETAPLHEHEYSYVFTVLNGSTMDVHDAEGKLLSTFTAKAGETLTFDLVGDELVTPDGNHRISKTHSATNVGTTVFKELLVEKKRQTERTNVHFLLKEE